MFSKKLARQIKYAAFGFAAVIVTLCGASPAQADIYCSGYIWESWTVTTGPASMTYSLQQKNRQCNWDYIYTGVSGVAGGMTNAAKFDSGWLGKPGPGAGLSPTSSAVRAVFADGTIVNLKLKGPIGTNLSVSGEGARFDYGFGDLSNPLSYVISQNLPEFIDVTGQTGWLQAGSMIKIKMPLHFQVANLPDVNALNPVDIELGVAILGNDGHTLLIPVLNNQRMDPFNGIIIENMIVQYDGVGIPLEYPAVLDIQFVTTPVGDPMNDLEMGNAISGFHLASVLTDPAVDWFDETGGDKGFADFDSLLGAYIAFISNPFNGENTTLLDLEDLEVGEKLADQYLGELGVFFSGADGGQFNDITGIAVEGDPFSTEDLTGYDGTYQPDGSQVYIRFQNTVENPDAPFTIHFTIPQRNVAAFLACGVQGSDHSFTVTAYDGSSQPIDVQQVTAQLWEEDPTGQNYETVFAVKSAIPNIRSVSIVNNSTLPFADALLIDSIQFATSPAITPGDTNLDGIVGIIDLLNLLEAWGECPGDCPADFDSDGFVSLSDLLILLANWS